MADDIRHHLAQGRRQHFVVGITQPAIIIPRPGIGGPIERNSGTGQTAGTFIPQIAEHGGKLLRPASKARYHGADFGQRVADVAMRFPNFAPVQPGKEQPRHIIMQIAGNPLALFAYASGIFGASLIGSG